jgi:hypothetical protein
MKINGEEIRMLCFTNDIAMIAEYQKDLQRSPNVLDEVLQRHAHKTKT